MAFSERPKHLPAPCKTMNRLLFICSFLFTLMEARGQTYIEVYPNEATAFQQFKIKYQSTTDSVFRKYGIDRALAISIVAPEIGHYSVWQDKMEVAVVSLFYVEMGTDYNNFSVGYFQMKAGFAEKVEEYIQSLSLDKFASLLNYRNVAPTAIREERLARMQSVAFQSAYLAAFITICKKIHPDLLLVNNPIKALATAYNVGFWHSSQKISVAMEWRRFPSTGENAFSYAEVAAAYYQLE